MRSAPEITEISPDVIATLQSMEVTSTGSNGMKATVASSRHLHLEEAARRLAHRACSRVAGSVKSEGQFGAKQCRTRDDQARSRSPRVSAETRLSFRIDDPPSPRHSFLAATEGPIIPQATR